MHEQTIQIPVLSTKRLILREFRQSDLDTYTAMSADEEVMRYLGDGKPMSREDAWRSMAMLIGHWHLLGYGMWAVELRESGELIGRVGFFEPEGWPGFEIGWTIARPHWGKGYAPEAATAVLEHGFEKMDREHIISLIHVENRASIRVAEKIGERREREIEFKGKPIYVYGIGREQWREVKKGAKRYNASRNQ